MLPGYRLRISLCLIQIGRKKCSYMNVMRAMQVLVEYIEDYFSSNENSPRRDPMNETSLKASMNVPRSLFRTTS